MARSRRRAPGEFDSFLFADYSGAASEAAQRKAIALFRMDRHQALPRRIDGPFTRVLLRERIVDELQRATEEGRRALFGIDHQWSWPIDLLKLAGLANLSWRARLAALARGRGRLPPLDLPGRYAHAFNHSVGADVFHSRVRSLALKYEVPTKPRWSGNPIRLTETLMRGAKPSTRLGGTGAVAGQTITGLLELHFLVEEVERRRIRAQFWPFDALHDDGNGHVGCEIYPTNCRRELGAAAMKFVKTEWSEHDRDAALTCVWSSRVDLAALLDLRALPLASRKHAEKEGWILGTRDPITPRAVG